MTKLFKNSKRVLAFVFAFAVLAVSLFTGSININADACDVTKIAYWDGSKASSFASGTGSEADPYIIKTAAQLAFACLGQDPTSSTGKYYKIDDSVKVFVMQPESVVNLETLLALNSAETVKNYLTGLSGVQNWMAQFSNSSFNGNFDGNGATIYGLYADGVAANKSDVGLFPHYDGGKKDDAGNVIANTCKNISVKNSYFNSSRRVGAISGASYGTNFGAKIDGIIHYDTIAVVNCYITAVGNTAFFNEQGIVADGGGNDVSTFNNILVRGNYAKNTELNYNMGVIAATYKDGIKDSTGTLVKPYIKNSILLDMDPYRRDYFCQFIFTANSNFFDNVVTDHSVGKATIPNTWGSTTSIEYTEAQIKQVTATGNDFKDATKTTFDWENVWFMSQNGSELRAFHGQIELVKTATTHVYKCKDCGLKSFGAETRHTWTTEDGEAYKCSVCQYNCLHSSITTNDEDGDCVEAPGTYTRCNDCDYVGVISTGTAPGHTLTYVEADPGDCATHGHTAYYYCEVCDKKFATDNKFAAMDTALTDAQLDTGLGSHIKDTDEDGAIIMYDETGHWYICKVDGGRLDYDSNAIADDESEPHEFNNDGECIHCGYVCTDHDWYKTGKVTVVGSCTIDKEGEIKCRHCGKKESIVTEKAGHKISFMPQVEPTDRMEGTKAHYECSACKGIFSDAEGKNSITKTSLIIPKVLPAEYQNTINSDKGDKSPATSDSFASVIAVAALAGATLVLTRK